MRYLILPFMVSIVLAGCTTTKEQELPSQHTTTATVSSGKVLAMLKQHDLRFCLPHALDAGFFLGMLVQEGDMPATSPEKMREVTIKANGFLFKYPFSVKVTVQLKDGSGGLHEYTIRQDAPRGLWAVTEGWGYANGSQPWRLPLPSGKAQAKANARLQKSRGIDQP